MQENRSIEYNKKMKRKLRTIILSPTQMIMILVKISHYVKDEMYILTTARSLSDCLPIMVGNNNYYCTVCNRRQAEIFQDSWNYCLECRQNRTNPAHLNMNLCVRNG